MDSLPVELVRLIFEYCDAPSVRTLRLAGGRYAELGYEFLLGSHFDVVEWRNDIWRLYSIAGHDRLRDKIRSVTFNFASVHEYNARHATFFKHWLQDPEERDELLRHDWNRYYEREERARHLPPAYTRTSELEQAFQGLPNLRHVEVTFTRCPHNDLGVFRDVFSDRICRKFDRELACKNLNAIVSAVRHANLDSFSIDQLPLDLFRIPETRRLWFDCARSFASLSRLRLVLDVPDMRSLGPQARFRTINGLGHVLQQATNLTHLSLAFHTSHAPAEKFPLSLHGMFSGGGSGANSPRAVTPTTSPRAAAVADPVFPRLTDLHLEGVSLAEKDLRFFLLRHAATLERLRLGGRGLARPHEAPLGGVHLHEGSFRGLFSALQGRLPRLRRFHMEGDAEAGDFRAPGSAAHREVYMFRPVTDDEWRPVGGDEAWVEKAENGGDVVVDGKTLSLLRGRGTGEGNGCVVKVVDSRALERFLVEGNKEYPRLGKVEA
ncbi:hypothetical protein VTJ04DRAFT_5579 [Mycothermus thermophilus]|uniref:uncharacterized protein n=1 Tax=Humicola insolens TaxID=85995 RepID=UPI00374372E4